MIGAARYFPNRYFAPRYFPKVGSDPVAGTGGYRLLLMGVGSWLSWLLVERVCR